MLVVDSWSSGGGKHLLEAPGAFVWWYLDLINAEGDGVVLIWSYGLPFIPSYDLRALPLDKPSINLAIYRNFKQISYTLHELPRDEVEWIPAESRWRFGQSLFSWEELADKDIFRAEFNLSVPGSTDSIKGSIEVTGRRWRSRSDFEEEPLHLWCPTLAGAVGSLRLLHGEKVLLETSGRAYLDHNRSSAPLDEQGIAYWHWGRIPFEEQDLIYYLAYPESEEVAPVLYLAALCSSGEFLELPIESVVYGEPQAQRYGLEYPQTIVVRTASQEVLEISLKSMVEDGPFYLRAMIVGKRKSDGSQALGTAELVCPNRINREWQLPFVRMRIQREPYENSIWVPLFCGPRENRIQRLIRSWFSPPGERSS